MPHKDYIKRAAPKATAKGKPKPKPKPKARAGATKAAAPKAPMLPPASSRPYVSMVLMLLVVGGFGYFLWSINGAADTAQDTADTADTVAATVAATAAAPTAEPTKSQKASVASSPKVVIPPPPEQEDWQYIDELKNKEVAVNVAKLEKKGPFLMQCATFKDQRRAEAFKAQLALLGFESRIKTTQGSHGERHRVQLGPYEMNRDAQRARHKLSKHKINGCKIWLWS